MTGEVRRSRKQTVAAPVPAVATTLTEQATARIRESIVTCRYMPGSGISEGMLAAELRIGKAPVRAALARLAQDDLVRGHPRKGYVVAPLTTEDMLEVFQLRLLMEPRAAALAAGHLTPAHIERMNLSLQQRPQRNDEVSRIRFLQANRAFHSTIAEACGNRRLEMAIKRLLDEVERMLHLGYAGAPQAATYHDEHAELMQLLIAGDAQRAERLAYEQISHGQGIVLQRILSLTKADIALQPK